MKDRWIEHDERLYNLRCCKLILKGIYKECPSIVLIYEEDFNTTLTFEDKNDRNLYFEYLKELLLCDEECDSIA